MRYGAKSAILDPWSGPRRSTGQLPGSTGKLAAMQPHSPRTRISFRVQYGFFIVLAVGLNVCFGACLNVPKNLRNPDENKSFDPEIAPKNAGDILSRYILAIGSEAPVRALQFRTVEARVTFKAENNCIPEKEECIDKDLSGQLVLYTTAKGHLLRRTVIGDRVEERGYDGKTGWRMQLDPQLLFIEDEIESLSSREDALLHWYLDFAQRDIVPELLPSRKNSENSDVRTLDGIRWQDQSGKMPHRELWFDRETGLLAEEIQKEYDEDVANSGEEKTTAALTRHIYYDDYRAVDGVKVAHSLRQVTKSAEHEQEVIMQVQSVHHRPIDAKKFPIPKLEDPEPIPDPIIANLDNAQRSAQENPQDATAAIALARRAYQAARFDLAKKAALRTLELDKQEPEAAWILARIELFLGNLNASEQWLDKAEKSGVNPNTSARQRAMIELARGNWPAAAKRFAEAGDKARSDRYRLFSGKPLQTKFSGNSCTISMELKGRELPIVEAFADDEKLRLLFDTGATDLVLSKTKANSLVVLPDANAPLLTGGSNVPHGQTEGLKLATLELQNVPVVIFPDATLAEMAGAENIDGVLGLKILSQFQITVDPQGNKIELVRQNKKCKKSLDNYRNGVVVPIWLHENQHIFLHGQMNGSEGVYMLNSGMRGAALTANSHAYARAGIGAPPLRRGQAPMVKVRSFSLGDGHNRIESSNLSAAFGYMQQQFTSDQFRIDGMLGWEAIGKRRWTIDLQRREMYISATPASLKSDSDAETPQNAIAPRPSQ